jgi:hypothetical protein
MANQRPIVGIERANIINPLFCLWNFGGDGDSTAIQRQHLDSPEIQKSVLTVKGEL